ncbi:MAG: hypothetical protein OWQ54_07065 [Sulfolobaceae archaeon]|nr:hypothetical protein [Sulfolobaceae archaeon]
MRLKLNVDKESLLFSIVVVVIYVLVFYRLLVASYFSLIDLEPPPPHLQFPSSTPIDYYAHGAVSEIGLGVYIYYYLSLIFGSWNLIKIFAFIPFPVGTISFYYVAKYFTNDLKKSPLRIILRYIVPFIYILNPGTAQIFYTGDSPTVLLIYSFMPLVYYLSYKIYKYKNLNYFIILTIIVSVLNVLFYQAFYYAFLFEVPILIIAIVDSIKLHFKSILLILLADVIAFLSNVSQEIAFELFVVPTVSHISTFPVIEVSSFPTFLLISIFILLVIFGIYEKNRLLISSTIPLGLLLFIFTYFSITPVHIPLIGSIILSLTTFESKIFMFAIGLISISLIHVRIKKLFLFVILIIILSSFLPSIAYYPLHDTYDLFTFNPVKYEVNYTALSTIYRYLSEHDPLFTAMYSSTGTISPVYQSFIPMISGVITNLSEENLTLQGIKYIISTQELNYSYLVLVYNVSNEYYIYYNEGFHGISYFLNGTPANVKLENGEIIGERNAVVLIYYNPYWTNATDYNNYILLRGNISRFAYTTIQDFLMSIDVISLISPFIILMLRKILNVI